MDVEQAERPGNEEVENNCFQEVAPNFCLGILWRNMKGLSLYSASHRFLT